MWFFLGLSFLSGTAIVIARPGWHKTWLCHYPSDLPVSLMKLFSGKKQNIRSRDYAQVLDYQVFWIIIWQIKGIFLYYSNEDTPFTSFTYPFLTLRSLSPHSIITNIHIFLSLSYSFLLVAGWDCPNSYRCSLPLWESQNICTQYFHSSAERTLANASISDAITGHSVSSCKQTNLTGAAWNHCKKIMSANFLIKPDINKGNIDEINVNYVPVLWVQHFQYF
jgi:hypothetical protein